MKVVLRSRAYCTVAELLGEQICGRTGTDDGVHHGVGVRL